MHRNSLLLIGKVLIIRIFEYGVFEGSPKDQCSKHNKKRREVANTINRPKEAEYTSKNSLEKCNNPRHL